MEVTVDKKAKIAKNRAFELDVLRGIALVVMLYMHFAVDLRYMFDVDAFDFLEADWFWAFAHPVFLSIFVGVSGVCCTFSRNNLFRGLKLMAVAIAFTAGTWIATEYVGVDCLIIFNVLHLLSLAILLYAMIGFIEEKFKVRAEVMNAIIGSVAMCAMVYGNTLSVYDYTVDTNVFYTIIGIETNMPIEVADYIEVFPWIGVFLAGCLIGRVCYKDRKSLVPKCSGICKKVLAPLDFLGRHSQIIYIVHQPIMYGVLYLIFSLIGR